MKLFDRHTQIEDRASAIEDPVERLRFLRQKSSQLQEPLLNNNLAVIGAAVLVLLSMCGLALYRVRSVPQNHSVLLSSPGQTARLKQDGNIWLVEHRSDQETYSNGLHIETRFTISNTPRPKFQSFPRDHADLAHVQWRDQPAGIVYHSTESQQAPFAIDQNRRLQQIAVEVLMFVQHNHSYHYVIDRFGRVFRIVQESDVAFHAGHSVWADDSTVFINLNSSFLGVAFETQSQPGEDMPTATPAQVNAARLLTEMLRAKYKISTADCVTHAQVSVNPSNMRIGYHTDWAGNFPFTEIGLTDNYAAAPASLTVFGFIYDPPYLQSTGVRLIPGLLLAETQIGAAAARRKMSVLQYRATLQKNYKEIIAAAKSGEPAKEIAYEQ